MARGQHRVLYIGGTSSVDRIRTALTTSHVAPYDVECLGTLSEAVERLTTHQMSAILLDLQGAGAPSLDGLKQLSVVAPMTPILVVAGRDTEHLAQQALTIGASDYVLSTHLDHHWLPRILSHVIQRRESENVLFAEKERLETTLNSLGDALLCTNVSGRICYLNDLAVAITGWSRAEAADQHLSDVLHVVDHTTRERIALPSDAVLATYAMAGPVSHSTIIGRGGSELAVDHWVIPMRNHAGTAIGATTVLRDVSAARANTLRLSHLASHDPLTDLPNRLLLGDRLTRSLVLARRHRWRVAVLVLDLDHFKDINDSFGHHIGDKVLQVVGQEVSKCVRTSDTVSRHGGDEFVVVLSELENPEDAAKGAEKIIAALASEHTFGGHEFRIRASIGISVFPSDGDDGTTLLIKADMALYRAKERRSHGYQFFDPELNTRAMERQANAFGTRDAADSPHRHSVPGA